MSDTKYDDTDDRPWCKSPPAKELVTKIYEDLGMPMKIQDGIQKERMQVVNADGQSMGTSDQLKFVQQLQYHMMRQTPPSTKPYTVIRGRTPHKPPVYKSAITSKRKMHADAAAARRSRSDFSRRRFKTAIRKKVGFTPKLWRKEVGGGLHTRTTTKKRKKKTRNIRRKNRIKCKTKSRIKPHTNTRT